MKTLIFCGLAGPLLASPAFAQPALNGANNNAFGRNDGAIFQLPPRVNNVVSIDAFNMLILASEGERPGETQYTPTIIQHVYSGGIARLFGGTAVPTAQFVTPGQFGNNGNNNNNGGVAGVGGNNGGFGGNTNNGGFGGAQNGFGGGFQNNGGFQNGALNGQGFNTINRNTIVNARVRGR